MAEADPDAPRVVTLDEQGNQRGLSAEPVASELIDLLGATGKPGELHRLPDGSWLLGIGDGVDEGGLRHAGATLSAGMRARAEQAGQSGAAERASLDAAGLTATGRVALAVGLILGSHRFKVSRKRPAPPGEVRLVVPGDELAAAGGQLARATALAGATAVARDLASAPSDVKSPTWLVETAAALAEDVPGLTASVRPHEWLVANGFGGMLAVGGGSSRPPALLRLTWEPAGATKHLVLVGKGITFDTGGISIKPAEGMHLMRTDMAGGAAVIGAMLAIARLELPIKVTGLVPAAENHVSGSAYRPGDVVRHYDGQTTEVTNTDAEGRMVLADAIGYAVRKLSPDLIVDVATLTGAMKVSLGLRTGGLFATDDALAEALLAAGERTGEQLWRMPLLDHVAEEVPSEIADLRQIPKGPSGIGAALFLRAFTGGLPWAHLDIAGPARCEKPYREVAAGATGFAARTLTELAEALSG